LDLLNKIIRVNYSVSNTPRFITGKVIDEDDFFISIKGLRDGTVFRIAKASISEIREGRD